MFLIRNQIMLIGKLYIFVVFMSLYKVSLYSMFRLSIVKCVVFNKKRLSSSVSLFGYDLPHTVILYTREIPAFGGISLALRRSGAVGATFGRRGRPRWGARGTHLGNRRLWRR